MAWVGPAHSSHHYRKKENDMPYTPTPDDIEWHHELKQLGILDCPAITPGEEPNTFDGPINDYLIGQAKAKAKADGADPETPALMHYLDQTYFGGRYLLLGMMALDREDARAASERLGTAW